LNKHIYIQIYFQASCKRNREAPSFDKFQQFINLLQKPQPEIEICNRK